MINAIIAFSIRYRTLVIAASAVLAALGIFAAWNTPVDAIPDLSENQVIVFTDWKGHGPREVEDQVTYPLALSLAGIPGVRVVRSSSDFNFSIISVILEDSVDFRAGRQRVAQRLSQLRDQLPAGVAPTLAPDALATGQIFWYTVEGGGLDLGRLRAIQDWYLRPQLGAVAGVAEVASVGGFPIEYQVNVDPKRLQALNLPLSDVLEAVSQSNSSAGGHVIHKGNAEYVVRSVGWLGDDGRGNFDATRAIRDLEKVPIPHPERAVQVADVAKVSLAPGFRRGVLEKDGSEVTGGVVLMAYGENPLEVTRRIKEKIVELRAGLPPGVRIVPFYDRTPLIEGAIGTVTGTLVEAVISATVCVLLILLHVRTSFIIAITLPLAALTSFLLMAILRWLGIADVQTNIMSLAGIAISIGILVDSSMVVAENAMHHLKERFGDRPVRGDVRAYVLPACQAVGRPIVFFVGITLLSFLPVFALGGIEGKMFRPLAVTKSFAMLAVALFAITLVPALCTIFIRGRLRREEESPLVRGVIEVYRPVLSYLLERPAVLVWGLAVTFIVGFAPIGSRPLFLGTLFVGLVASLAVARTTRTRILSAASLIIVALVADQNIEPLGREFITPLDEGMVMDMPITVPRASVTESGDDLKARDMVLCRFPEVDMVVGKAGRAETATDPAPLDMIETMVNFRPREFWPRRKLRLKDAALQAQRVLDALVAQGVIGVAGDRAAGKILVDEAMMAAMPRFDAAQREFAYQRNQEALRDSGGISPASSSARGAEEAHRLRIWRHHLKKLDEELHERAAPTFTRIIAEELLERSNVTDPAVASYLASVKRFRAQAARPQRRAGHHHGSAPASVPAIEPATKLATIESELAATFSRTLLLWQVERDELAGFGGELDRAVSMPGWTNVWTMPIQNRVDMLATGVNTAIGIRVLGRSIEDVVRTSEAIAAVVKRIPGATDVVADPLRGKPHVEIHVDRDRAARVGVSVGEIHAVVETALGGKAVTTTIEGRERHPVVVRYGRAWREDEESVRSLLVTARGISPAGGPFRTRQVALAEVADVRVVEGPATIKGENGLLRNYVRLNVRGRSVVDFVDEARRIVGQQVKLPNSTYVEWTGQFEYEVRARTTLMVVMPIVIGLIFLLLYWTYHDFADAALMMLAVPGAIAGGVFFQWLLGLKFSITVWVGYIACFGMATSTGIIMLVYLREAVARAGGLENMDLSDLRKAVMNGAVHRLRPKLLTEGTTVIGLAPMLWATGVGAEVIRPMAAPVLGGILIADEVIDLFLPVLFYWVRRWRWERLGRASTPRIPRTDLVGEAQTASVGG
jgi:Cu(I)/Ag(I) efflux system membrane protein CusA/SilA